MPGKSTARKKSTTRGLKELQEQQYLSPESQKALSDRLARLEGHVRAVRRMVQEHRCADEVLLQIAAVKAAISKVAALIVDSEMKACVQYCMEGSTEERLDRTLKVLSTILKQT